MIYSGNKSDPAVILDELKTDRIVNNVITVGLCIFINYINATLVYTFFRHEILKMNHRYVLYIHLVINDIILLTIITLIQIVSYAVYYLNVSLCLVLLLLAIAADYNSPLTLVFMALECYIAVCYPLRHSRICTMKRTYFVIGFIWFICALKVLPDLFSALAIESPEFFQSHVLCLKGTVIRLSYIAEKDTIFDAVVMALVWMTLIYIYLRILFTAKSAAADARKARNTVLLHSFQLLLSMLTYLYPVIFKGLRYLFPNSVWAVRFASTIIISVLQRLISPLVYGLRDKTFRKYLKQHIFCAKAKAKE